MEHLSNGEKYVDDHNKTPAQPPRAIGNRMRPGITQKTLHRKTPRPTRLQGPGRETTRAAQTGVCGPILRMLDGRENALARTFERVARAALRLRCQPPA